VLRARVPQWARVRVDLRVREHVVPCIRPAPFLLEGREVLVGRRVRALLQAHVPDSRHVPVWVHVRVGLRGRLRERPVRRLQECVLHVRASVVGASVTKR